MSPSRGNSLISQSLSPKPTTLVVSRRENEKGGSDSSPKYGTRIHINKRPLPNMEILIKGLPTDLLHLFVRWMVAILDNSPRHTARSICRKMYIPSRVKLLRCSSPYPTCSISRTIPKDPKMVFKGFCQLRFGKRGIG